MIGKLFNNRYIIEEKIGSGGTAIVYRGLDNMLKRKVTIKILREEYANDEEFVRRFRREATAVANLSHGNIVSVYDVGFEENLHYIVMEFVEGESLKAYIKRQGALPLGDTVNIICQALDGIEYAHERGVVHRDIKSHNILIARDGRVKVTDFGIAVGTNDVTMTYNTSSRIMGSVHYIAPEQVQGASASEKTDIYSAGVVLYEMLTGQLPFDGDTPISIAMQHVQGELLPPHQVNSQVPVGLSYVVMRAMRKTPEFRYSSARDMKNSVVAVTEGLNTVFQQLPKEENLHSTRDLTGEIQKAQRQLAREDIRKKERQNPYEEQEYDEYRPMSAAGKWVRGILIFLAVVLVIGLIWMVTRIMGDIKVPPPLEVEVPKLEGLFLVEATQMLLDVNLQIGRVERKNDNDIEENRVISQGTPAGNKVPEKRSIDLVVSLGPSQVEVPKLIGYSRRDAEFMLSNRNLQLGDDVTEEYNDDIPIDEVIRQFPTPGTKVKQNETVQITVSLGKKARPVAVPNIEKNTLSEGESKLKAKGLKLGDPTYKASDEYVSGIILSQSIAAEEVVDEGTTIDVTVSEGPGPVQKVFTVTYLIPDDERFHTLTIKVDDVKGSGQEVYSNEHFPGTMVSENITYYSKGAINVYLDDVLVHSEKVE